MMTSIPLRSIVTVLPAFLLLFPLFATEFPPLPPRRTVAEGDE